jgi:signal transduction histidine kinase/CheY-like chemotaxis protein
MTIDNLNKAENFVKNLKRSDNWVSNDELLTKLNDSYQLIKENNREDLIPYVTVNLSLYYIDLGEYGQAWEHTEVARKFAEKFENYECLLNAISNQYRIQRYFGNLDIAQELVNKQIEIALQYNNDIQLFSAFLNQAYQYYLQDQKEECLQAFKKTIEYSKKSKNKYSLAMIYITFSGHLIEYNEYEEAELNLLKGYEIAVENNFTNFIALANSNFGILYDKRKKYAKAIDYYKQSINTYYQISNTNEENQVKIMYAEVCLKAKKYSEAEKELNDVLLFSKKFGIKSNLNSVYFLLSELYEKQSNHKKSLLFYKKYKKQSDEIYNLETGKRIKNLEISQKVNLLNIEKNNALLMASVKHDFLANMSHEIRTPINSILGICYLLSQQDLTVIQNNYVNRLRHSGENLLGIINDVLDISKIESGKMELTNEVFSLNTIINNTYYSIEFKAQEKFIKFKLNKKFEDEIFLNGDAVRLQQVLLNLLSNAIKFTEKGSVVMQVEYESNNLKILIKDTGIGISKDKIDRIFERYEQADAGIKDKFGGTGLGLSITKKIIELMNGSIDIKSIINKGTEFIVQIPISAVTETVSSVTVNPVDSNNLNDKIILIADDNEENRLVAKEILLSFNPTIKILEAENGKVVLDILKKQKADIIFIDLDMPIINGIDATQQIRKNKKYDTIKIIGNTASLSTFTDEELRELGFNDFLFKPYKPNELLKVLVNIT